MKHLQCREYEARSFGISLIRRPYSYLLKSEINATFLNRGKNLGPFRCGFVVGFSPVRVRVRVRKLLCVGVGTCSVRIQRQRRAAACTTRRISYATPFESATRFGSSEIFKNTASARRRGNLVGRKSISRLKSL